MRLLLLYFITWETKWRKKESDQQKMSEFDQQIQQCNNELASLNPILSNAESILPEAYLSTSTLNYIKRQVQRGESWVRAVQNYQIQRITNENGVIEYGSYPKTANGDVRPIEWITLDRKADRILLITKDCIDCLPLDYFISKSWEESPIRHWLNHDFINKAFSSSKQNNILTVKLENKCSPLQHNPDGNTTNDKIFFLSYEEALNYFSSKKMNTSIEEFTYNTHSYYCNLDKHAQASLTPYALEHFYVNYPQLGRTKQAEYNCSHNIAYSTRTCTIGDIIYDNSTVYRNGFMAISYKYFNNDTTLYLNGIGKDSIRPAMWLKLYN